MPIMPAMTLQDLLGKVPQATFIEQYFHCLPFSLPEAAKPLCELGDWDVLGRVLAAEDPDVMVVRDGRRFEGPEPDSQESARRLSDEGYTILVRHAERHHEGLRELAERFGRDFRAPVNIHMYATPAGRHGFSWHYDAEDVFIFQTAGAKEYALRKNTVHPWPLVETIPADMRYPSEIMPLMRVLLTAGDWLYIPCGYWHKAEARGTGEAAISLALGVMSPAAIDIYDSLRARLLQSLLLRQRLPVRGEAASLSDEQLAERYGEIFRQLADDLVKMLNDEQLVRQYLNDRA